MRRERLERMATRISALIDESRGAYDTARTPDEEKAVIRGLYAGVAEVLVSEIAQRLVEDFLARPEIRRSLEGAISGE